MKRINLPLSKETVKKFKKGQELFLCGPVLTARDAAHKRMADLLKNKLSLPVPIKGEVIYYTGPASAPPGAIIGACGPTTSSRMDIFTPLFLQHGLLGMIGKGRRGEGIMKLIRRYGAVYFMTIGGAGAYLSSRVVSCEQVAFRDLGPEAVYRLILRDFPVIVA